MAPVGSSSGRLIIDTSGLLALANREPRAFELLKAAVDRGLVAVVPAVVLAQTYRGADARLDRALRAIGATTEVSPEIGLAAGLLLARSGMSDAVDAILAAEALAILPAAILTSDVEDFERLLEGDAARPRVAILSTMAPKRTA